MSNSSSQKAQPETKGVPVIEPHYKIVTSRYNSFLVATAFLVTAYATVIVVMHHNFKILLLADAISAVGLYLAFFFTVANFHGSLLIVREQIIEDDDKAKCDKNIPQDAWGFVWKLLSHLKTLFLEPIQPLPRTKEKQIENAIELKTPSYVHTWAIPLLLFLFWLIVPFCVLPHTWMGTPGVYVGILVIWLGIIALWGACNRESKNEPS